MSFWRMSNGFSASSSVDKILDRDSFTLYDLLADPEVVQELLVSNSKLIEYLREPETLDQLVDLIIANVTVNSNSAPSTDSVKPTETITETDKSTEEVSNASDSEDSQHSTRPMEQTSLETLDEEDCDDDKQAHDSTLGLPINHSESNEDNKELSTHYASIACEILSADVYSLTNSFMLCSDLLARLWGILDTSPLPMTSATFFTKINEHLLDEKTDDMLNFIKSQDKFIQRFMNHIDNPPLMDFLLKVISTDKADNETGIIELLHTQKLIPSLISFLSPQVASSIQSAAGDFLKAFVTISANSNTDNTTIGPNTLSRELVSEPVVKDLVSLMLHGGTGLATGVGIVIEIIRKNNSDYDYVPVLYTTLDSHPPTSRDPIYLGTLVKVFSQAIPEFQQMLDRKIVTADGHTNMLKTPFGEIEPLGFERFKICELVAELLHCSNMGLLNDEKGEAIVRERDQIRESQRRRLSVDSSYNDEGEFVIEKSEETGNDSDNGSNISSPTSLISAVEVESRISRLNIDDETISSSVATLKSIPSTLVKSDDEDEEGDTTIPSLDNDAIDAYDSSLKTLITTNEEIMTPGNILKLSLYNSETLLTILTMFFRFPWNNFLHNVVFDIVQQVLNGPIDDDFIVDQGEENQLHNMENKTNAVNFNKFLAVDLFGRGQLTRKIVDGQKRCDDYEAETGTRMGYMGHLTLISEEVVKFSALIGEEIIANYDSGVNQHAHANNNSDTASSSDIDQIFEIVRKSVQDPNWIHYVTEILVRTREMYNALLGGGTERDGEIVYHTNPNAIILGNGDDDEEEEVEEEENDEREGEEESDINKEHDNHYKNSMEEASEDRKNRSQHIDLADNGDEYDQLSSSDEEGFAGDEKQQSDLEGGRHEQFARYMSEQIGMGVGRVDRFGSSDEDEDEEDEDWANQKGHHQPISNFNHHNSKSNRNSGGDPELFEDLKDDENEVLRNDDVEYDNDDVDGDFGVPFGAGLTRSSSKQDTEWDDEETRRIVGIAMYLQDHENETSHSGTTTLDSHNKLNKSPRGGLDEEVHED
ncbi:SAPS-domain-containing protein [Nadsonia fulvescens var. elongata DSM 6958]|uniref:SAPS-domain-containing protein n=1 Tax=Nadsonia fulvescens var. elongata DSM 6958 TaxID=857566 RepID=A0A1E3PM49_9ASCO|nr:SAPS-domain-containing protein [Nadsonia fulvescens var. elongata DSM 6958]